MKYIDVIAQMILDNLIRAGISVSHKDDEMEWHTLNRLKAVIVVRLKLEISCDQEKSDGVRFNQ